MTTLEHKPVGDIPSCPTTNQMMGNSPWTRDPTFLARENKELWQHASNMTSFVHKNGCFSWDFTKIKSDFGLIFLG
jgi:hypothetical protein